MAADCHDVIIVGAGIMGLSIAYQIARRSSLNVVVLEKGRSVAEGSTGASSAVLRHRYTFPEVIRLARDGINAYRAWSEFTGISQPRAAFEPSGALWLNGTDPGWASAEVNRLGELGVRSEVLDDDALAARFPGISTCVEVPDVVEGRDHECHGGGQHLFEIDGGFTDPVGACEDLLEAARRESVQVRFNAEVVTLRSSAGRVDGVDLRGGERLDAAVVVNATGPWCHRLIEQAGITWPWRLVATRIQVLYLQRPTELPLPLPVCVDPMGGVYFRLGSRGQQLVAGSTAESDEREAVANPDVFDRGVDGEFSARLLHALHHRLPSLPYRGVVRGYSGLYTVNRDDVHPLLGATALDGFVLANGFSGHGFKLAPAIGSLVAQYLTGERASFDSDVPIEFFDVNREPLALDAKSVLA